MSNAYFRNSDPLTVGSNINGPQVQFEYAGRMIQIPVPNGVSPIVAANDYIRALRGGFGGQAGFNPDDVQPSENPDLLENTEPSTGDDSPSDMTDLDKSSDVPADAVTYSGSLPSNYGSGWSPDGINTVKGYQPVSALPVLIVPEQATGNSIPTLSGFFQGDIDIPRLRLRRGVAGLGLMRGG